MAISTITVSCMRRNIADSRLNAIYITCEYIIYNILILSANVYYKWEIFCYGDYVRSKEYARGCSEWAKEHIVIET